MAPAQAGGALDVRLMGRVAVRTTAGWRDDWPRPAARRLVALLALSPTRSQAREVLADRLFGHLPADRALRNVSKALSMARNVLGPGLLLADSATVWIADGVEVRTDLAQDAHEANRALVSTPPPESWPQLRSLLARADQLLAEDLYEDWAQEARRDHEALARGTALVLARSSGVAADWARVLMRDPCDVEAWSAVLTAAAGRSPAELDSAWSECRLVHAQESQAPPPPRLRQLVNGLGDARGVPAPDLTVGRDRELRWIEDRAPATARGGDSWVLHGAAGIGKTHLLDRAAESLRDHGCLVLRATCVATDAGGPFAPLSSALRATGTGPHPLIEALGRGGTGGGQGWSAVRLADDVAVVLDGYGARLALVVDDVHWADPALKALMSRLCTLTRGRRWSLVLAGRSDEPHHPLPSVPSSTATVRVAALTPQDTAVLARRLIGADRATDPGACESVVQALVARSEGNPFFLTELARDAGGAPATGVEVPERVQQLLGRRLQVLTPASRHALAVIACAGERATAPLLARVLGEQASDEAVRELTANSLLRPTPSAPWTVHPLLREVVVSDLTAVQACQVNDQLAVALGQLAQESGRRDLAEAAAGHALAAYTAYPSAERAPGAAAAGLASGGRMLRSFAPEAAAATLEQALAAFADAGSAARAELRPAAVDGWLDLGRCRLVLGDATGAERAVRAGLELAGRPLDRARCYRRLAALNYRTGRMAETAGVLEVALLETRDEVARAVLETELGWTLHRRGRAAEALPVLERATRVFEDGGLWDLASWSLDYLGMTHVALGDVEGGLQLLDRALARDGVAADHHRRGVILIHRGGALRRLGRLEEALGSVDEGRRIVRRARDRYVLSVSCRVAADIHEAAGDLVGAVSARTEELTLLQGSHNHRHAATAHAHLASLYRRLGRSEDSERAMRAARLATERSADPDVVEAVTARLGHDGNTAGTPGS